MVSTPEEIVKYMVKNTLGRVCVGKTPEDILQLRIADIACGSGIFLEEVYQYLIDYCTAWYDENKTYYLLEQSNGRKKLPLRDKKDILIHCIYGVDIDIHAVEVSKFSLLLKLIEDETEPSVHDVIPILPDLSQNVLHGNSLISDADLENHNCSTEELLDIVPLEWESIEKFDVILGNPPYVKTEDMHFISSELEFQIYKKKYKSAYKQFDKYFLFVEKALDLLRERGLLCYIIPNKFYKIGAGQEFRKILSDKIKSVDDFGDLQLFPDKTIYSSIVTIGNESVDKMKYTHVESVTAIWSGEENQSIEIKDDKLNQDPWRLTTDINFMRMLDRMEGNSVKLSVIVYWVKMTTV